jgi:pantothenate kinase-related protein Tda10
MNIQYAVKDIKKNMQTIKPIIIGIEGYGGSGKTTVAGFLVTVVPIDKSNTNRSFMTVDTVAYMNKI